MVDQVGRIAIPTFLVTSRENYFPGSSSLIGLLTENGQLMTNDDSLTEKVDGVPQLFVNPYGWSNISNVIYLESPKGVGFSYCDNVKTSADCINTDESTALDSYEFLVSFFESFPEYKSNQFFITGESYAGIYIPMLMERIDQDSLGAKINLIGAAIGNGCWGNIFKIDFAVSFFCIHSKDSLCVQCHIIILSQETPSASAHPIVLSPTK